MIDFGTLSITCQDGNQGQPLSADTLSDAHYSNIQPFMQELAVLTKNLTANPRAYMLITL